ncbi:YncE family protein [Catenovulum maritimum]|uniref:BACON domain-containing protein n=1 Tax=Catenovulum maritimum TaxID=1513271 RepID=A0A0J8GW23_9ALTE|nr:hypothetical protein [Catenovulum maritimum]KMT66962.1 hypothetical protein XM47_02380 [Catenovulum maritimum]
MYLTAGVILLSSCGGGSASYEISTDVNLVEFVSSTNDSTNQSKVINVNFKGDGVIVGYPPGEVEPHWLSVNTINSTNNTASFRLISHNGAHPGTYTTNLRFLTGKQDGSVIKYKQVKVTLVVKQGFSLDRPQQIYSAESVGRDLAAINLNYDEIQLIGDDSNWSINKPDWVSLSEQTGQGSATITLEINPEFANYGTNSGKIEISDSISGETASLDIHYELKHGGVTVDNQPHAFSVGSDSNSDALMSQVNIQDDFNGLSAENVFSWQFVSSTANWLTLAEDSGSTSVGSNSPMLLVNKDELMKLKVGEQYKASITISTSSDFATLKEHEIEVYAFIQASATSVTNSQANQLDFKISDAAFSASNQLLAFSDTSAKKVYIVDAVTGMTVSYYLFDNMPETLSISPNGKYLYVSLLIQEHDYFQHNPGGKVAVIDIAEAKIINKFDISIDPWDIEGTDARFVFVSAGSGQWTEIKQYNAITGVLNTEGHSRHRVNLALSADQESIFSVTTDSSPGDVYHHFAQSIDGNDFLVDTNSPYHGDYSIGDKLWLDTQNELVVTEFTNSFNTSDLTFKRKLPSVLSLIHNLTFDYDNNKVVLIEKDFDSSAPRLSSLNLPNYDNYQVISTSIAKPMFVFNHSGEYIVIAETETGYDVIRL